MKTVHTFGLIVGLGLVLNAALQVSGQHLSCDDDEDLPSPPECPPVEDPNANSTYFPVPYDCRKFFESSKYGNCLTHNDLYAPVPNGVAKCLRCAPGTVWSQEQETCDHEDYTECVIVTTTVRPTDPPRTTGAPTEEPTEAPTTTTPTTTITTEVATTEQPTTISTTDEPTTTTTPTTTTSTQTDLQTPHQLHHRRVPGTSVPLTTQWYKNYYHYFRVMEPPGTCNPSEPMPTYFPYPYNCSKYFQCSNGVAVCMQCANGTVWNQELTVCDQEAEIGCVIVTTTVNPLAMKQAETGIVSFFRKLRFW